MSEVEPMESDSLPEQTLVALGPELEPEPEPVDDAQPDTASASESESDSDSDSEAEQASQLQTLESELSRNPVNYDAHFQYIQLLRKLGEIDKLRRAREAMNLIFPLTPQMWQDWVKDELTMSSRSEAVSGIEKLYERGVSDYLFSTCVQKADDVQLENHVSTTPIKRRRAASKEILYKGKDNHSYSGDETGTGRPSSFGVNRELSVLRNLSVPLWCDYLDFVQEHEPSIRECTAAGVSKARDLFERALTAGGLHFSGGSKIWESYKDFEQAICLTFTDSDIEGKEKQIQRIRSLYQRQLSVPLADIKSTLIAYKIWEVEQGSDLDVNSDDLNGISPHVASAYKKALEMYSARIDLEEQISRVDVPDAERLPLFKKYLKFEESAGDPARVQILYERAIAEYPIAGDLWLDYTRYLDKTLKVGDVLRNAISRATRNCPWVGELWVKYLLCLERARAPEEEVSVVFEKALQCTFSSYEEYLDIFLTRIDGLRRRMSVADQMHVLDYASIRDTFQRASDYLSPQLKGTEALLRLHAYWARLELILANDVIAARGAWENILKLSGAMLEAWQGYISMEIEKGNLNEARSIYRRCYTKKFPGSGSEACHISAMFYVVLLSGFPPFSFLTPVYWLLWIAIKLNWGEAFDAQNCASLFLIDLGLYYFSLNAKFQDSPAIFSPFCGARETIITLPLLGLYIPSHPGRQSEPSELALFRLKQESKTAATSEVKEHPSKKVSREKRKLPSNMPEDQTPSKRRKDESDSATKVTKKDQGKETNVDKMEVEVTAERAAKQENSNDPSGKQSRFVKPRFTDQCTAYVSNLSFNTTYDQLHKFFSDTGGVQSIRILKDKYTGKSRISNLLKGLAYVDFSDDEHLNAALAKNKKMFMGIRISVVRSDPSKSKKNSNGHKKASIARSDQGKSKQNFGGHQNADEEASRIPSSDQAKLKTEDSSQASDRSAAQSSSRKESGQDAIQLKGKTTFAVPRNVLIAKKPKAAQADDETPKSNSEFREMFLKK
ncbi:hypothetical protein KSS87_018385 [Heliosperma pusillum]|nr:hypothetical protein KSS87_018385 [Heliosperma pusillum]